MYRKTGIVESRESTAEEVKGKVLSLEFDSTRNSKTRRLSKLGSVQAWK